MSSYKIIIIGAGPAGLGAAYELSQQSHFPDWHVYEKETYAGGLCASFSDTHGFTWDIGGHVFAETHDAFDILFKNLMHNEYLTHKRRSWIHINNYHTIPYPFQTHIHLLPEPLRQQCITSLIKKKNATEPASFLDWLYSSMGDGISELFMIPYNQKLWCYPLHLLSTGWAHTMIPPLDPEALSSPQNTAAAWRGNAFFKTPLYGGSGSFFQKIAALFSDHMSYQSEVIRINPYTKTISTQGHSASYEYVITTLPLDHLILHTLTSVPEHVRYAATQLHATTGYMVGVGFKGKWLNPIHSWGYFADPDLCFYRITAFSEYSPYNVPRDNDYFSLMCEITLPPGKNAHSTLAHDNIIQRVIEGLQAAGILTHDSSEELVSSFIMHVQHAYPIPTVNRDAALETIQTFLRKHHMYSIGRFGSWIYEKSSMNACFAAGMHTAQGLISALTQHQQSYQL